LIVRIVAIAVVIAGLWFGYRWLFPSDEAQIREVLDRIAEAVGNGAEEGEIERLARAASLRNYLDAGVKVDAGPPFKEVSGRDVVIGTASKLNSTIRELEIRFIDVQISLAPDRSTANVYMTAEARFRGPQDDSGIEARELDVLFRKIEGNWVVSAVAFVRTLEPVTPR
jgi:hypothetical protein